MCVNDQDIKGISRHSSYGFFKLQYYMSLIILLSLFFFSIHCVFGFTPVASAKLQSAVPGRRRGKPQSAW